MPADSIGSGHHTPRDGEVTDCSQHAGRLENCRHRPYTEEIERTYGSQNHSTVAEFFFPPSLLQSASRRRGIHFFFGLKFLCHLSEKLMPEAYKRPLVV